MALHRVGANGRVALGDLAEGVEFYSTEKDADTGVVTLTPVKVVAPTAKRATAEPATIPGTTEDDQDPAPFA